MALALERTELDARPAPALGRGVYSLSEAARYTGLHPARIRAWFKGRQGAGTRRPVFRGGFEPVGGEYAISFLDLIDAYVVGRFRNAGVTMPLIRKAYAALEQDLGTRHPFAHGSLYTDGRRVIVGAAERIGEYVLYDAISKQLFFPQLHESLDRIDYHAETRLAERWRIAEGVTIDPRVALGKPVVRETGIHTSVLARQYAANRENAALVADLFGVSEAEVRNAVRFERTLKAA